MSSSEYLGMSAVRKSEYLGTSAVRKSEYVGISQWTSLLCHREYFIVRIPWHVSSKEVRIHGHITGSGHLYHVIVRIPGHVSSKEVRIPGHVRGSGHRRHVTANGHLYYGFVTMVGTVNQACQSHIYSSHHGPLAVSNRHEP